MSVGVALIHKHSLQDKYDSLVTVGVDRQTTFGNGRSHQKSEGDSKIIVKPGTSGLSKKLALVVTGETNLNPWLRISHPETYQNYAGEIGNEEAYIVRVLMPWIKDQVDALRKLTPDPKLLHERGEIQASIMIVLHGRVFVLYLPTFSLVEFGEKFVAIGNGAPYALGSLYTSSTTLINETSRVKRAIEAAAEFDNTVGKGQEVVII